MNTLTQQAIPMSFELAFVRQGDFVDTMADKSDEEIVKLAQIDKDYFACLVQRYERKIKVYIKKLLIIPEETVEDITQEVFLKIYANLDKFNQDMRFSSWIYRIAHNQAVNKYLYEKKRKTETLVWDESGELKSNIKNAQDTWKEIQQQDLNEVLHVALKCVSQNYQEVIALNYFQGKSYQEISDQLQRPINTIGTMLNRGRKLLMKELEKMGITCDVALL